MAKPGGVCTATLLVCAWTTSAAAEAPCATTIDERTRPEAHRLADAGAKALAEKRFDDALATYERAYCLFPLPGLRKGASWAELELGRCEAAVRDARFWVEHEQEPRRLKAAQEWLSQTHARCGQLTVQSNPPGATLRLDGEAQTLGVTPWEGWARAGSHDLIAEKDLFLSEAQHVEVKGGVEAHSEVLITLRPVPPPASASPPLATAVMTPSPTQAPHVESQPATVRTEPTPTKARLGTGRKIAIAVFVAGAAALGAATAVSVKYAQDKSRLEQNGLGPSVSGGVAAVNTDALAADISWGVGGVLAALGTGLVVRF